ncbi:hypothetical protein EYR40_004407 [Pleurotus pulmonarius]|nr:hypothetical protein EYR40_004407 [Pleurotus pulmonarius]KAF4607109.1 hypothetical protein EYR38_001167 [Pleurotus pulmonarius]
MPSHPEVLWAQRSSASDETKNVIYLTVNLTEIKEPTLVCELEPTKLTFKATAGASSKGIEEKDYEFALDLFEEIDPEKSSKRLTTRSLVLVLRKKEKKEEYWPRLTKEKIKHPFIKTDFSRWVDEDEQDGADAPDDDLMEGMGGMGGGMGGMPGMEGLGGMPGMGGMGGMPGMGGMGGMDFEKMMASMGGMGGAPASGGDDDSGPSVEDSDDDDDGPPPLEQAEPTKP